MSFVARRRDRPYAESALVRLILKRAYSLFQSYGYKHWIPTRPCNDVYDVVATEDYYIANDRDLYTGVRELVVYDRLTGERISSINIGCDCSIDIDDDGRKVIYYNANTGYIEERNIPNLDGLVQLFKPGWPAGSNGIVKYIPGSDDILIAAKGGTVVQQRSRTGTVVDSITTTEYVVAASMEPENWLIATYSGAGRDTLHYYRRSDKVEVGRIPNLYDGFLNIHVKVPFVTFCSDKGPAFMTEYGGVPFNVFYLNTNSLYPILKENLLVGTYYFSIFEIPMTPLSPPVVTQCYLQRSLTGAAGSDNPRIPAGSSWDISFLRGLHIFITSDQPLEVEVRAPVPVEVYGYSRVYTSPTPEYVVLDKVVGCQVAVDMDVPPIWGNLNIKNVGVADANVKLVGGYPMEVGV
jgi:hypothetical protein